MEDPINQDENSVPKFTQEHLDQLLHLYKQWQDQRAQQQIREDQRNAALSKVPEWHGMDGHEQHAFITELVSGSERSAVIVGTELLSSLLANRLMMQMINQSEGVKRMFGSKRGSLDLARKSDLAFGLGLISSGDYDRLSVVRNIRNEFAHTFSGCSFATPKILALVDKLEGPDDLTPRMIFMLTVAALIHNLGNPAED